MKEILDICVNFISLFQIGAQVSIGNFSIGANINLIGGTSVIFGWDTDLGNGMTKQMDLL